MANIKAKALHEVLFTGEDGKYISRKPGEIFMIPEDQFSQLENKRAVVKVDDEPVKSTPRVSQKKNPVSEETPE